MPSLRLLAEFAKQADASERKEGAETETNQETSQPDMKFQPVSRSVAAPSKFLLIRHGDHLRLRISRLSSTMTIQGGVALPLR